jgi:hypothetical protein
MQHVGFGKILQPSAGLKLLSQGVFYPEKEIASKVLCEKSIFFIFFEKHLITFIRKCYNTNIKVDRGVFVRVRWQLMSADKRSYAKCLLKLYFECGGKYYGFS